MFTYKLHKYYLNALKTEKDMFFFFFFNCAVTQDKLEII